MVLILPPRGNAKNNLCSLPCKSQAAGSALPQAFGWVVFYQELNYIKYMGSGLRNTVEQNRLHVMEGMDGWLLCWGSLDLFHTGCSWMLGFSKMNILYTFCLLYIWP